MVKFKKIKGFDGKYWVGTDGNVYSMRSGVLKRLEPYASGGRNKYLKVSLYKKGKRKTRYVHRLVAKAFIRNRWGKPCVNHIDGDAHNNRVENLEWCTHRENTEHYYVFLKNKKSEINSSGCLNIHSDLGFEGLGIPSGI